MPAAHHTPPGSCPRPIRGLLRPWARPGVAKLRLGRRLASGLTPAQAARAEDLPEAEVAALVADPGFAALVDECRALDAQPEDEARRKLASLARFLLMDAVSEGDMRAVIFVVREENRGRDPARTLADGVLAFHRRAATAPPTPPVQVVEPNPVPAAPKAPRPTADPVDRMGWRAAAGLRAELRREVVVLHRAMVENEPAAPAEAVLPPEPAPASASPTTPERKPRNRRERHRSAALRRHESGGVPSAPPGHPRPPPPRARSP